MPLPDPSLPWPIPLAAVAIIAESEGLRLAAYRCPAGVPTIGWGETDGVRMGDTCTREQADRWLLEDVTDRTKAVRAMCTRDPSANELGALVSLAYNIGVEALRKSTALRQHNAGDHLAASRAICLWDKARVGGVLTTLPGLTARRAREQALYLTPDESVPQPVPQAVEAESPITSSPVARTGATITAGGEAATAQPDAGAPSMPAGEAPDWTPPPAQETPAMAPILAGFGKSIILNALPAIVQAIPRLGSLFATSEQAQKNVKALEVVTQVAADAIGATNAQQLVEGLQDADKAAAARNVVDNNWALILDMTEAGSGGIDGARKADKAITGERTFLWSPSFWMGVLLLPIVYLIVLNVIGVLGTAQWSPEARAGLAGMLSGTIVGGLVGYYYGQTTSRNRAAP